jgi:hypothetical protein
MGLTQLLLEGELLVVGVTAETGELGLDDAGTEDDGLL